MTRLTQIGMFAVLKYIPQTFLLALIYFGTGWFGLTFAAVFSVASPVWPPSGLALCFLLFGGWKNLPAIILGVFAVESFYGLHASTVSLLTIGNSLEAAIGYLFLSRLVGFKNKLERSKDVMMLAFCAALAPVVSATFGAYALVLAKVATPASFLGVWATWWSGDALGILVVAPLILSWWKVRRGPLSFKQGAEILLLGVSLALVCRVVFTTNFGGPVSDSVLAFLTFPFLLWAALRFGMRGAATASALVAFVAIQSVAAFSGPFRASSVGENVWLLQTFQVVSSLSSLLVAALIAEKLASNLALHNSELRQHETQKYESLGIMAGGIAHDFNNLLTAVLCNAELLQIRRKGDSLVGTHTDEIQKAARKASALCQQMVAFSGCTIIADVAVDLNEWLGDHLKEISLLFPQGVRLQMELSSQILPVNIHPDQLLQVLQNLLLNSVEAYQGKNGIIEVETGIRKINHENARHNLPSLEVPFGNYVYLTVRDNGQGMPGNIKDRIFEPFFTTKFTGRGLGLAFVLGIVRGHQGTLQVVSQPEKGTEITVLLPVRTSVEESEPDWPIIPAIRTCETYLFVDDDDLVRDITVILLEETGAKVFSASNGVDALEIYRKNATLIDAVIIDWIMPGMTGYEVAGAIREIQPGQAIVLTSGFTNEEVSLDLAGTGKTTFLPKPFTTKDIVEKIREVVN